MLGAEPPVAKSLLYLAIHVGFSHMCALYYVEGSTAWRG